MAEITHKGKPVTTVGELPAVGSPAPGFKLAGDGMSDVTSSDFSGQPLVLNIFPSLDTRVCALSVRTFNKKAASLEGVKVLCVSNDLPYAQSRFCGAEGITNVTVASGFRSDFGDTYGVRLTSGLMEGLLSRAVVVVDADGVVTYTEQVPEISQEPDYDAALAALAGLK